MEVLSFSCKGCTVQKRGFFLSQHNNKGPYWDIIEKKIEAKRENAIFIKSINSLLTF
jgi:hypothetical protein